MSNKYNFIKKITELLSEKNPIQKEIIANEILYVFAQAKKQGMLYRRIKNGIY